MMELGEYPFSKRYGWIADRYGVSWQIIYMEDFPHYVRPFLMFTQTAYGKAEEALNFYASLFANSEVTIRERYQAGEAPDREGSIKQADMRLAGLHFGAMESAHAHQFVFSEGVSLIVNCADQQEINYFWSALSAVAESEQCGWLKDKYGVSWQVVPYNYFLAM